MASRCSARPHVLLPFLYPPFFPINGKQVAQLSRPSAPPRAPTGLQRRFQSTVSELPTSRLNPAPDDYAISNFADKAKLTIYAGVGGNGCISFLREAFMPEGPANGGNGGHGGNIYIQAVHGETSLHKLARRRLVRAGRGRHGQGGTKAGQRGEDAIIAVPVGTVVKEVSREDPEAELQALSRSSRRRDLARETDAPESSRNEEARRDKWLLYPGLSKTDAKNTVLPRLPRRDRLYAQPPAPIHLDLSRPTPRPILLAAGGIGGLGNPHFVSKQHPRPTFATKGERAVSMTIELELKLLADVGLVGLPNAGKSTLLRAVTNSRARVGSWAFTTLQPNIGTVVLDNNKGRPIVTSYRRPPPRTSDSSWGVDSEQDAALERRTGFTMADIPGLIEGAHLDRGLGIAFLRHVERAGVLAFVVDLAAGDAVTALNALWTEVGLYAEMREEEERDRERDARVDWGVNGMNQSGYPGEAFMINAGYPMTPPSSTGLHIAAKPWFVVATKADLPDTQENFAKLRDYLTSITNGNTPHPSGVDGAWTLSCAAIPVSAINGQGVENVIHWTVGLLDG